MEHRPNETTGESPRERSRNGIIAALIAYISWGVLPLYFILVKEVDSLELLVHRVIWAIPFGALIIHMRRQWPEVRRALTDGQMLRYLTASAILIAGNWLVYIWAVQQEQIFQASLGYYINPLLFAVVGVFFFGEKLRRPQTIAISLAAVGVAILAVSGTHFPAIALFLGTSFTIYGVIRKKVVIGGMPGLFIETLVLLPLSLGYLFWITQAGNATFSFSEPGLAMLLVLAGPITVVPLLCFALAARRLNLSTLGMMQFIAPTLQFLVGVAYGEQLTRAHIMCFTCIWVAVAIFSWDAWRSSRARPDVTAEVT
jgi:chloramphenicol-sensitive protein RarD